MDQSEALRHELNGVAMHQLTYNLTNHTPRTAGTIEQIENVRNWAKALGGTIIDNCPESRERSLALTNLEQTVMWAVAAIARNQ